MTDTKTLIERAKGIVNGPAILALDAMELRTIVRGLIEAAEAKEQVFGNSEPLAAVVEEGERLLRAATEGHWHVEYPMDDIGISIVVDGPTPEAYEWRHIGMIDFDDAVIAGDPETDYPITKEQAKVNAALIVHLHNNAETLFAAAKETDWLRREVLTGQEIQKRLAVESERDESLACLAASEERGKQILLQLSAYEKAFRLVRTTLGLSPSSPDGSDLRERLTQVRDAEQRVKEMEVELDKVSSAVLSVARADAIREAAKVAEKICLRYDERAKENGPYSLACDDKQAETAAEISLAILSLLPEQTTPSQCEHEWIDARNEVVASGEMCVKCNAIRSGNSTPSQGVAGEKGERNVTA